MSDPVAQDAQVSIALLAARKLQRFAWLEAALLKPARILAERYPRTLALALYALGAVIMQRHAVAHLGSQISGNGPADPTQFMWAMWWFPHAILHGLNPFVTDVLWVPDSLNTASITTTPVPALVLSPITWLAGAVDGPVASYNLANLLAPVISAWFTYRLCLKLTAGAQWPSIFGGWIFAFSSYALGELQGHLQLVFTFLIPVLALLALGFLRGEYGPRRVVLCTAVAVLAQMGCGTEMLLTGTLLGALGIVFGFIFAPSAARPGIVRMTSLLVVGYVLAGIIGSPFLYYALTGPAVGAGQGTLFPADLLSFVIPTPDTWVGGRTFLDVSAKFPGNTSEQGTYLGVPLILMVLAAWKTFIDRPVVRALMLMTIVSVIVSLGVVLTIVGQPTWSMPWKLLANAKLFNQILPVRLAAWTAFGVAVCSAMWLAGGGSRRWRRWLLALAVLVTLFPNADAVRMNGEPIYSASYNNPAFITQGLYKKFLHRNEVVLPIPWDPVSDALLWQAQARGYFWQASGWFGNIPADYGASPISAQLIGAASPSVSGVERAEMTAFLHAHFVGAIIVSPGQTGWDQLFASMHLRHRTVGGVDLYSVPNFPAHG